MVAACSAPYGTNELPPWHSAEAMAVVPKPVAPPMSKLRLAQHSYAILKALARYTSDDDFQYQGLLARAFENRAAIECFTFNCYKHWATLVIRNNLPFIRARKVQFSETEQTWYADDAGAGGKFDAIKHHFEKLEEIGPHYGYFPEPSKSILIVPQKNLADALIPFQDHEFTITTGSRYLDGFIGEHEAQDIWIQEKVAEWADAVEELASAAVNYPQSAYTALLRSLQQEWHFFQRVVKDIGDAFTDVEKAISQYFLPALFGDDFDEDDPRLRLAGLPVKHAGMAQADPMKSAESNYEARTLVNVHLVCTPRVTKDFVPQIIRPPAVKSSPNSNVGRKYEQCNII
jgi:hypothetical protein